MMDIWKRLFGRPGHEKRAAPRQLVRIPVRALVGVELKRGQLEDLSSRGARIRLQGISSPPGWVDLECVHGIQRGLVRWSRMREGDEWEGGLEFERPLG
ncbi:PilZ domain-containing protein [bacterium]|nr:PilZ domain-containing protein [bacterium]